MNKNPNGDFSSINIIPPSLAKRNIAEHNRLLLESLKLVQNRNNISK